MPSKNTIKIYQAAANYHLYNRGVEKRKIFQDKQDYMFFMYLLKRFLSPSFKEDKNNPIIIKSFANEISLLSFFLSPNHFHFQIYQTLERSIESFMRSLMTAYSGYFNEKYQRVGSLFQGVYRGLLIKSDEQMLHLSRYIHINNALGIGKDPFEYPYSSFKYYLGRQSCDWVNTQAILDYFEYPNRKRNPSRLYANFCSQSRIKKNILNSIIIEDIEEYNFKVKK